MRKFTHTNSISLLSSAGHPCPEKCRPQALPPQIFVHDWPIRAVGLDGLGMRLWFGWPGHETVGLHGWPGHEATLTLILSLLYLASELSVFPDRQSGPAGNPTAADTNSTS